MGPIVIREDFRRDGLSMNFLVDKSLMLHLARAFPNSKMNIGYPAICQKEEEMCQKIAAVLTSEPIEIAVVGHALPKHLEKMSSIVNKYTNASGNFWIPISDYFIGQTLKKEPEKVLEQALSMVKYWKNNLSDRPIDVALADCTAKEEGLRERLSTFYNSLKATGARSIIVCDTRGIGTPKRLTDLLAEFRDKPSEIEFHPHNDNGLALENIETAVALGAKSIGTSVYGFGERATMIDPRNLVTKYNIPYNPIEFEVFDKKYKSLMRSLRETEKVFTNKTVVTGTQYRLQGRDEGLVMKFGVSSDKFILSKLLNINITEISDKHLAFIKDQLYIDRKRTYTPIELKEKYEFCQKK